jgi:hypothetical protein
MIFFTKIKGFLLWAKTYLPFFSNPVQDEKKKSAVRAYKSKYHISCKRHLSFSPTKQNPQSSFLQQNRRKKPKK